MKNGLKNKITIATLVATVAGVGVLGVQQVSAQSTSTTPTSPMSSLVQKIAQKFNLNQTEVQSVFDEEHKARQAERLAQYDTRLSQLVSDGKITEAQKQLILNKSKELQATHYTNRDAMQNMTVEERRTKIQEERLALQKWATDNNIDIKYLMMVGKGGRGGMHSGMGKHGMDQTI